jgi:rod shape-determining protein MreC
MREYIDNHHLKVHKESVSASRLRRPLLIALLLCVVSGALLWFDLIGFLSPVRAALGQVISPVAYQVTRIHNGAADSWGGMNELRHLQAENEALRQEQSQLRSELIAREQALVENERLRQQLEIEEAQPWSLRGAEVTMHSPDAVRRVMTIAGGSAEDIEVGMAVVGQTGTGPVALVGIVEEVGRHTASVLLTTDFGSRVSARVIHDGDSALGLVQGQWQRGSRLRLEHLDREHQSTLVQGAIVVTAGLTAELDVPLPLAEVPPDIPIGEIETIVDDGHSQFAELRPYADPDQVRYVWVILDQEGN